MEEDPLLSSSSQGKPSSPPLLRHLLGNSEITISPSPLGPPVQNPDAESQRSRLIHRSNSAPAMSAIDEIGNFSETKPGKLPNFGKPSIVKRGVLLLVLYLSIGMVIYFFNRDNFRGNKTHPVVDALYFCIITMCTIGYADITPNTTATKLFAIVLVLLWFAFLNVLLTGMIRYTLDSQSMMIKGRMSIGMKVALALGGVVLCIVIWVPFMHFVEQVGWFDSFYLTVMAVTTVGYGERGFRSLTGRIFASVWLLVSTFAVGTAFLYLAKARVDRRDRRIQDWVLSQDLTVAQFSAADIDNKGFVSKSDYVIYKLKEMGKVPENDILQICKQFARLDSGNCGKITLSDLTNNHL